MRQIVIKNPTVNKTYKTFLDAAYTTAAVTLTAKSNVSFAANDILVVGEPGIEFSESKKLNSISGTTIFNLPSTLNFNHPKEEPIYKVLWDQFALEANYGSGFAIITISAIQWDSKSYESIYYDANGNDSTSYRFRFYNSVTSTYSEYSSTVTGSLPARASVIYMIKNVRRIAQDPLAKFVSDDEIIRFFNRGQDIIYAKNPRFWFLLVDTYKGASPIAATANTNVYSFSNYTNFGHLDTLRYRYTSGSVDILWELKNMSSPEFNARIRNLNKAKVDYVRFYKLLPADSSSTAGYFMVDPTPQNSSVGNFYPNYYKKMTDLVSTTDLTIIPYPSILEDYAVAEVLRIKGEIAKADIYEGYFYGPADAAKRVQKLTGIVLLEEMDRHNKQVQGQPSQLFKYRGQKATSQLFGEDFTSTPDYLRENYFDSRIGG